ncbi:hypothetical protein MBLNU230_g5957t1 [Neophaeotheca triangularis]
MGLFDRPAWAKDSTVDSDDEVEETGDIFRHSDRSYQKIVEDQERQRRERLERHQAKTDRQKLKQERKAPGKHKDKSDSEDDFDHKKRRFNAGDGAALLSEIGLPPFPAGKADSDNSDQEGANKQMKSGLRSSSKAEKVPNRSTQRSVMEGQPQPPVVELDDSDDDQAAPGGTASASVPAPAEPEDEESDEEFAALARQARERHRQQQLGTAKSATPDVGTAQSPAAGEPPPDPIITILITSRIPGTKPLMVHRRYTQRLKEIRTVWCDKQGFSAEFAKDVFLTHRLRRLWDVTTCKSLGLGINDSGQVYLKGDEGKEGVDKVHLEAMTNDYLAQASAEEARKKRAGDLEEPGEQTEPGAESKKTGGEKQYVRIILKAKGKEDFKLKVKDSTAISKIIMACSNNWELGDVSNVWLEFDGEKLEPSDQISNTEITDLDMLDVHIP